ncbi:MAG: hypothetical protein PHD81_03925 [Candidatus Nanoarchaeia archaeon]|nr:hypothetical protein [Candidatus Nanoarchaeia archaeon]MDD5588230.1 hypothetical protein [Candidatus Nanoarchaeia archaeon]
MGELLINEFNKKQLERIVSFCKEEVYYADLRIVEQTARSCYNSVIEILEEINKQNEDNSKFYDFLRARQIKRPYEEEIRKELREKGYLDMEQFIFGQVKDFVKNKYRSCMPIEKLEGKLIPFKPRDKNDR